MRGPAGRWEVAAVVLAGLALFLALRNDDDRSRKHHGRGTAKERVLGAPPRAPGLAEGTPPPAGPPAGPSTVSAPPTPAVIEGTLFRFARVPAAGVRVRAVPKAGGAASDWVPTDSRGGFRIEGLDVSARYRLVAKAGPFQPEVEVAGDLAPGGTGLQFDLGPAGMGAFRPGEAPAAVGRIRIVGHDGGAVPRAHVAILEMGSRSGNLGLGGYLDVVDGTFARSAAEPWGAAYEVLAPKDARGEPLPYGPATHRFAQEESEPTSADVVLPPERTVDGRVLGPDGDGVEGLVLRATTGPGPMVHATAKTAADGSFRLRNLGDRDYAIDATPPPALLLAGDWSLPRGAATLELRLRPGVDVEIRVVDYAGRPVAKAAVGAHAPGGGRGRITMPTRTDDAGRATLRSLDPASTYRLSVSGPFERLDLAPHQQDAWAPAETVVTLRRGYVVSGTVRDSTGLSSAGVVLRRKPDGSFEPLVGTDPKGDFRAIGLPEGPLTIAAAWGFGGAPGEAVTVEAGATGVILIPRGAPPSPR